MQRSSAAVASVMESDRNNNSEAADLHFGPKRTSPSVPNGCSIYSYPSISVNQVCKAFTVFNTCLTSLYLCFLLFLLSSQPDSALLSRVLSPVFPDLTSTRHLEGLEDHEVGNCSLNYHNLRKKADIFLIGHVIGYAGKVILFRDFGFGWLISICWEFTEVLFSTALPNFVECWWDAVIFDVLLCNAFGIVLGVLILKTLGVPFLSWYEVSREDNPKSLSWGRILRHGFDVFVLLFFCNLAELNSFTLKRVFSVHKNHPLNVIRLLLHALMGYPVITGYRRLLYQQVRLDQLPSYFWIYLLAVVTEAAVATKHGPELMTLALAPNLAGWLLMLLVGANIYVILATITSFAATSHKQE